MFPPKKVAPPFAPAAGTPMTSPEAGNTAPARPNPFGNKAAPPFAKGKGKPKPKAKAKPKKKFPKEGYYRSDMPK